MAKPYFTIVMPMYNHERYVREAIDSTISQSFEDFELIVCNDGSIDRSLDVVYSCKDRRIRIINKPNGGTVSALNACLLESRGRFICWLSSDDVFERDKLRLHHMHHEAHPESLFSVAPFGYLNESGRQNGQQIIPEKSGRLLQFIHGNYVNGLSICASRDLFKSYGMFDNRYQYAHDVERWYRFLKYQTASFLPGDAQSFTRLGTGNTADADLLGALDVVKFLAHDIQKFSIRCFLPGADATTEVSLESFVALCEQLLNRKNIFFRCGLGTYIVDVLRSFFVEGAPRSLLVDTRALFGGIADDADAAFIATCLDEIAAWLDQAERPPLHSFAEHFIHLRNQLEDAQTRQVVTRYLMNVL